MGKPKIYLTPRAEDDLREIFNFLLDFSFAAADAQTDLILEQIERLRAFPKLGRVIPDFDNKQLRELIVGQYLVAYYIVSGEQIDILSIHHSSRRTKSPR